MEWTQSLLGRWRYIKACAGPGRAAVLGVLAALGIIGTIRDNFFPGADVALIDWIPPLPWYAWTIAVLVLLFTFSIEGGFRVQEKLKKQINVDRPGLQLTYDPHSCLKITGNRYLFSVDVSSILDSVAGVIVGLEAFDGMDGFGHLNRPFRFKHYPGNGQVTCNPGEKVSVNILFLENAEKQSAPYAGRLQLLFQGDAVPLPGQGPYIMKLRATGGKAIPDYKSYRIGIKNQIPFMESIPS